MAAGTMNLAFDHCLQWSRVSGFDVDVGRRLRVRTRARRSQQEQSRAFSKSIPTEIDTPVYKDGETTVDRRLPCVIVISHSCLGCQRSHF